MIDIQRRKVAGKALLTGHPIAARKDGDVRGNGIAYAHGKAWLTNRATARVYPITLLPHS